VDDKGRVIMAHPVVKSDWPADWEEQFVNRTNASLQAADIRTGKYGGTFFENEKSSYPNALIGLLKGQQKEALAFLQQEDDAAWSKELTMGVDWFPAFTLRTQTRKYFQFGGLLDADYRRRMFESAKVWSQEDPLGRKNPFWLSPEQRKAKGMTGEGWTPEFHNSWVDVRGTDNLRAMREQAIFLMAEETGNKPVAAAAKKRIREYAAALYSSGMPEWDSPNYLNHALTGWMPLYEFAKDPEAKALAKAILDFVSTSAAIKYFRGSWAGPGIRDYGNVGPHAGAAGEFWHYFGLYEKPAERPYRDFVHVLCSSYRPPAAVVELARRNFKRPAEMLASKPSYTGWQQPGGEKAPTYFETTWIGHHSQLGSLPGGHHDSPGMNLNGFRLLAESSRRGADTMIVFTSLNWNHSHSTATSGGDQIAQCRGNLIWMNAKPETRFHFFLPKSSVISGGADRVFIRLEKTWVALHLVRARVVGVNAEATAKACGAKKPEEPALFPDDHVWTVEGTGEGPCGFALEIGEHATQPDFDAFCREVAEKSAISLNPTNEVHFTARSGDRVGLRLMENALPVVFRDGLEHDWKTHWPQWSGSGSPVQMGWKSGELKVTAGGREFSTRLP
jgi:hypothetical protein